MALRFDKATLEKPKIDHNGYLQADAVLTRTGVFTYRHPDGTVSRELRDPGEVFKKDSLASLYLRPFTDGHPVAGRVDAKNTKQLSRGMVVSEAKVDGDLVRAKIVVTDQATIDKIMREKNPIREVSCGYMTETVKADGEFNGQRYDSKQTNIIYNHVALVPKGRAGPSARIRVDAEDGAVDGIELELRDDGGSQIDNDNKSTVQTNQASGKQSRQTHREDNAMTIKIKRDAISTRTYKADSFDITVADEAAEEAIKPLIEKHDAAIEHIRLQDNKIAELQGRVDELVEKSELPPERLDELGQERADIIGVATHLGLEGVDKLRNDEIKKLIVHKANPKLDLDNEDQSYINGRYDGVVETIKKDNKSLRSLSELRQMTQRDDYLDPDRDERTPRQKFVEDSTKLWESGQDRQSA